MMYPGELCREVAACPTRDQIFCQSDNLSSGQFSKHMTLSSYRKKRNLRKSPGPPARVHRREKELIFVVQKHRASHVHHDFRLELDRVLKSSAVPKGPPRKAADKRLAVQVEDHPYTYKDFEGEIPEGQYGAGTVEQWDSGT
jgi:bifunctional non-homologous end joining protein LigD